MDRRMLRRTTLWLIVGLVILGCASPVFVTPPPAPPTPRTEYIETIVVQTAAVAQTETALLLPTATSTATSTPLPTNTATETPTPTVTVVFSFLTATGVPEDYFEDFENGDSADPTKTPIVRPWDCGVLSSYPTQGTVLRQGEAFRAIWQVRNIGSKTWPRQGVDVAFHSGADLRDGKPYIDIPKAIGPGSSLMITINMMAPKRAGEYSTRWALRVGKTDFCEMRIAFEVK